MSPKSCSIEEVWLLECNKSSTVQDEVKKANFEPLTLMAKFQDSVAELN